MSIKNEVDVLVKNAELALKEYITFDQEKIDKIVYAMSLAGLDNYMTLAKMAVEETGRGVFEDKMVKNIFATEYIWNSIKNEKQLVWFPTMSWKDTKRWQSLSVL